MIGLNALPALYEDLANYFARQGEPRRRDQCLVLAADAALSANMPQEAERLRKRLLLTNPNHMLRPYVSMSEAMQSNDVRDYVVDLRKQWPPETLEKQLGQENVEMTPSKATSPPPRKTLERKVSDVAREEPVTFTAYALWVVVVTAGLLIGGSLIFLALIAPMI